MAFVLPLPNTFQAVTSSLVRAQVTPDPHGCRRLTPLGPAQTRCKSLFYLVLMETLQGCPWGSCYVPSCSCQLCGTPAKHHPPTTLASWWAFIPSFGTKEKPLPAFLSTGTIRKDAVNLGAKLAFTFSICQGNTFTWCQQPSIDHSASGFY